MLLRISHYTETSEVTENSTIPTHHRTCKASILCMKTPTITTKQTSIVSCRRCRILLLLWDEGLCRRLKSCLSRSRRRVCKRCLRKRRYVLVRAGLSVVRSPARLPLRSAVPKSAAATSESSAVVSIARLFSRRTVRRCSACRRCWRDIANCRVARTGTGTCDEFDEHGFEVLHIFRHGPVASVGHVYRCCLSQTSRRDGLVECFDAFHNYESLDVIAKAVDRRVTDDCLVGHWYFGGDSARRIDKVLRRLSVLLSPVPKLMEICDLGRRVGYELFWKRFEDQVEVLRDVGWETLNPVGSCVNQQ